MSKGNGMQTLPPFQVEKHAPIPVCSLLNYAVFLFLSVLDLP